MKKISAILLAVVIAAGVVSCGKGLYTTSSSGKDNVSYVTVLSESYTIKSGVSVVVDGKAHPYGKVYKVKFKRRTQPLAIEPGKHRIQVMLSGKVVADENVFIGLQETKQFVIR